MIETENEFYLKSPDASTALSEINAKLVEFIEDEGQFEKLMQNAADTFRANFSLRYVLPTVALMVEINSMDALARSRSDFVLDVNNQVQSFMAQINSPIMVDPRVLSGQVEFDWSLELNEDTSGNDQG